jgi:hypothetical protein
MVRLPVVGGTRVVEFGLEFLASVVHEGEKGKACMF